MGFPSTRLTFLSNILYDIHCLWVIDMLDAPGVSCHHPLSTACLLCIFTAKKRSFLGLVSVVSHPHEFGTATPPNSLQTPAPQHLVSLDVTVENFMQATA